MGEKTSHRTVPESPAPRADAEKIATPDGRDGEKAPALESRVRPGTGSSRGSLRGSLTLALITLLWLLTASYFVRMFHLLHGREHYEDFAVFYLSALELRADIDPYGTSFVPLERTLGMNTHSKERGTHPPTFLALFEPLTVLPVRTAYWTWTALNFVALVGPWSCCSGAAQFSTRDQPSRLVPWLSGTRPFFFTSCTAKATFWFS